MAAKNALDRITINSPCSNDWNSMIGNDQVRFCEHCSLQVHNLSEMTRIEAACLIARSRGRLCVRYYRNPNGEIVTRNRSLALYHIGRRASRIAAGAFSATLSLSSAVAHPSVSPQTNITYGNEAQRSGRWGVGAAVVGTITDANGAVVPGASVSLSNAQTGFALYTSTDDSGEFRFQGLPAGLYKMRVEAPGFAAAEAGPVYLEENGETRLDRTLSVASIESELEVNGTRTATVGMVAIVSPKDPLVRAAQEDNLEAVEALIANADVNLRDKDSGTTALEHAVMNGNREMVQLLLSKGADVNAKNSIGQSVIMILGEEVTNDLVWDLINAGAKLEQKDEEGNTALISLAYRNNLEPIKTLLEAGAKVDVRNKAGQTALMIAAWNGLVNNVRTLVLAGSDLNESNNEGMNALSYAMENQHRAVIRFLRSRGAIEAVAQVKKVAEDEK